MQSRLTLTIAFFAAVSGTIALLRPYPIPMSGMDGDRLFWTYKRQWAPKFSLILAGDSRVYRGVSPSAMGKLLPNLTIGNFGFSAAALTPQYLEAAVSKLNSSAESRILAIGVSPYSLTAAAAKDNGFLHVETVPATELRLRWALRDYFAVFSSILPPIGPQLYRSSQFVQYTESNVGYDDGWVASDAVPRRPYAALPYYRTLFHDNPVSKQMLNEFLKTVARFVGEGIHTYGFRVPSTPAMLELENEQARFDSLTFVKEFQLAGGVWLDLSSDGLQTYDGSHLTPESAIAFSRTLATRLRAKEATLRTKLSDKPSTP